MQSGTYLSNSTNQAAESDSIASVSEALDASIYPEIWANRILLSIVLALVLFLASSLLVLGWVDIRLSCLVALIIGIINPVWSIYALALFGPLYLLNQGQNQFLVNVEALGLGAIIGEMRLLGKTGVLSLDRESWSTPEKNENWKPWPVFLAGLLILIFVSSIPGWFLNIYREEVKPDFSWWSTTINNVLWGWASSEYWPLRCLINWSIGVGLAILAARRASIRVAARMLKFGAVGLILACIAGLVESIGLRTEFPIFQMNEIRFLNIDFLNYGRFQGTAGHAGWFGQWIIIMWPGVMLWTWRGSKWVRCFGASGLVLVALCLLLTAARASWLGVAGSTLLGIFVYFLPSIRHYLKTSKHYLLEYRRLWTSFYAIDHEQPDADKEVDRLQQEIHDLRIRSFQFFKPLIFIVGSSVAIVGIGFLLGHQVLLPRMENILRVADRLNYVGSAVIFLREYPLGLGLGTHFLYYESWFLPSTFRYYQIDHATNHNFYLNLLVENGPFVLLLMVGGIVAVFLEVRRAWKHFNRNEQLVVLALLMGLVGLTINGIAQYFFYIRPVEYFFWILGGMLVGLCRHRRSVSLTPKLEKSGHVFLAVVGILAAITANAHFREDLLVDHPRPWQPDIKSEPPTYSQWTSHRWRKPIDPEVNKIVFNLYRYKVPGIVTIEWPDGEVEVVSMKAEDIKRFEHEFDPAEDNGRFAAPRWLSINVNSTYTPVRFDPETPDYRPLGVYVHGYRIERETTTPSPDEAVAGEAGS